MNKLKLSNTIIFMHGGPATGKTSVGVPLAESLAIPYISKDGVKEPIFDCVGIPTAWESDEPLSGKKMDDASIQILFYLIEAQLQAGCACVIDSTFQARNTPALVALRERYGFTPIQVLCRAEPAELARRYRRRAETRERHPGHLDRRLADNFDADAMEKLFQPLDIGGHVLPVDTTDFKEDDFQELMRSIERLTG